MPDSVTPSPIAPETLLLEKQIEAINRFPDQNPNPVMRITRDGHLLYANDRASRSAWRWVSRSVSNCQAGPRAIWAKCDDRAAPAIEITHEHRTYSLLPVYVEDLDFVNLYGTDITAEKVVERFPNQNPNPVFRVNDEGELIYANAASRPLIDAYGDEGRRRTGRPRSRGRSWPPPTIRACRCSSCTAGNRTYALRPVRIPEFGFINVYGTDITAEKVVAKFPGQNPNPVLRISPRRPPAVPQRRQRA